MVDEASGTRIYLRDCSRPRELLQMNETNGTSALRAGELPERPLSELCLCVDCDGTLVKTDLLYEGLLQLLKRSWWTIFLLPLWLVKGKPYFKNKIAERVPLDVTLLPYNVLVLERISDARSTGRTTVLVTASPRGYAEAVSKHIGLFDRVFATDSNLNLSAANKAERLVAEFGAGNFVYAGNHRDDLAVWAASAGAIVVGGSESLTRAAMRVAPLVEVIPHDRVSMKTWMRAFRIHQWLKNLLVLIPLLAAHQVRNWPASEASFLAFVAFSFSSSATYVINDLLDLPADRQHRHKRTRPFASGELSIRQGILAAFLLIAVGTCLAAFLSPLFFGALTAYLVTTLVYSFWLKGQVMVDVMLLALLYTSRILAGSAATMIFPSFWLLAFSMFMFLSLALVKRYSEIQLLLSESKTNAAGRGYTISDEPVLLSLGTAAGYAAILILALYINSPDLEGLYPQRWALWLVLPPLLYWISRIWMKAKRGELHSDPVIFAATDKQSWLIALCAAAAVGMAST